MAGRLTNRPPLSVSTMGPYRECSHQPLEETRRHELRCLPIDISEEQLGGPVFGDEWRALPPSWRCMAMFGSSRSRKS